MSVLSSIRMASKAACDGGRNVVAVLGCFFIVFFVSVVSSGCGGKASPSNTSASASPAASATSVEAVHASRSASSAIGLRPGDAVKVEIWREPDLSGEFHVSTSGVIVFPLLGERRVTGVSAEALERQLAADYREYLENPSVEIAVLRRISILGEVRNPGLYPVDATYTLTDALALAGGLAPQANRKDIRLVRDGQVVRQSLDVAAVVGSSPVQSGDQIVVGQRSWLSRHLPVVTAGIGAVTSITIALFLR